MIEIFLMLAATSFLVTSQDSIGYGDHVSSARLHSMLPSKNVAFKEIGRYGGQANDWKYTKVYYISDFFKTNWVEAKAICRAFDLELATFETLAELENFQKLLEKTNPFPPNIDIVHVDGMTPNPGSSSDWYWTNSGVKIPYNLPWNPTQPDNSEGIEACLTIQKFNGKYAFNDYFCSTRTNHFICEKTELLYEYNS